MPVTLLDLETEDIIWDGYVCWDDEQYLYDDIDYDNFEWYDDCY